MTTTATFSGTLTDASGSGRSLLQNFGGSPSEFQARDETVPVSGTLGATTPRLRMKEDNGHADVTIAVDNTAGAWAVKLNIYVNTDAGGSGGTFVSTALIVAAGNSDSAPVVLNAQAMAVRLEAA